MSLENQTQPQASESDLDLTEQAILRELLNTLSESEVNSDDDVNSILVNNVYSSCEHPSEKKSTLRSVRAVK